MGVYLYTDVPRFVTVSFAHDLSVLAESPETVRSRLSSVIGFFAALVLREGVADLPLFASRPWNCAGVSKSVRV